MFCNECRTRQYCDCCPPPTELEWNDIATVPRDGEPILLTNGKYILVASIVPHYYPKKFLCKTSDNQWILGNDRTDKDATHWTRLPRLPNDEKGK